MNGAHVHLIFNHFPLVGLVFSILILIWGLIRKNSDLLRAGLVIIVLSGVFAAPTFLSGESAEEILEASPTFSEQLVEEHEEAAEFAIWATEIAALVAAIGLYFSFKKNHVPKPLLIGVIVLNAFTLTVLGRTNYLGGMISHPEIREKTIPVPHE